MKRKLVARAMDRWPRTFILGCMLMIAVSTIVFMACSVWLFGIYGPCYIGAVGFVCLVISALHGDIKDRKEP